ncbi:unnamed protein product [Adineta steineri]|uniref:Uncharacterized protein n=1 Tax=Adineta steineri TaxID=433720 RepID=A0A819QFU2_9BILA|nr:unnamed protein product [Adineta steineri]
MPTDAKFCSKWLQNPDNTDRVNSRWLRQDKTISSFQYIVCNSGDLSCANGGWANLKRHFNRPKHIQCMKHVFDSIPLTASNTTRIPFVIVEKEQRALTHDDSKGNIMTMRMNYEKSGEIQDFWPEAEKTGRF